VPSAIWSGTIGFGLVSVPVKLVSAVRSKDVRFHQLEEGTGSRIRQRRVSEATGEEVPYENIVKGYEVSPGHYVVVDAEELETLAPKASRAIEIEDFVELSEIDPIFFENPYYLVPDKAAEKPYRLLVEAMTELQKVAIGHIILRSKAHLVAIRPLDGALCVETMRYADEVTPVESLDGIPDDDVDVSERELKMAHQLIEALSGAFEPDKYRDDYRDQVLALIEKKAAGEEIVSEPQVDEPAKVLDLMAALEASLDRAGKSGPARSSAAKSSARKPAKKAGSKKVASRKVSAKKVSAKKAAPKKAPRSRRSA
jgi:DNA end-binding protein Ku